MTRNQGGQALPVSESEAVSAIALLPNNSWLKTFVVHGSLQTTSPLVYHIGVGLAMLGVTCPLPYGTHYAGSLRANNFVLFPGSAEGLIESLAAQESQFIPISEFGKFLSSAQRGYYEPIKTLLADAWDCLPQQRAKAARQGQRVVIRADNPRLSIGAACSIPYLEKHTLAEDWTGGFMGRWLVFFGKRERTMANPVPDMTYYQQLVDGLRQRATAQSAGWCTGLDPVAMLRWEDWYTEVCNRRLPDNIVGIRARAPTLARKIALVLGWDYGAARNNAPWQMGLDILEPAIAITELHIKSLVSLAEVIAEHPDARLRRSIIRAIDVRGGQASLGQVLGRLKMKKRPVLEMMDSLLEEGRVKRLRTSDGYVYELQGSVSATAS
jgi:hypothetical protein